MSQMLTHSEATQQGVSVWALPGIQLPTVLDQLREQTPIVPVTFVAMSFVWRPPQKRADKRRRASGTIRRDENTHCWRPATNRRRPPAHDNTRKSPGPCRIHGNVGQIFGQIFTWIALGAFAVLAASLSLVLC